MLNVRLLVQKENQKNSDNSKTEISTPVTDVKISAITIDTFGVNYDKPETIQPFNYMKWLYSQYGLNYTE